MTICDNIQINLYILILTQDEVGGGVLYVGGWDAAEDIAGLQAAGVSGLQNKIIIVFYKKLARKHTATITMNYDCIMARR